jgi:hypothetical protein
MTVEIETAGVDLVKAWAARAELRRLAEWLCKIYPKWIADKKTTQADADLKMAALGNALILVDATCTALEAAGAAETQAALPAFALGTVTAADREMRPQCRFCRSFGEEGQTPYKTPSGTFICPLPACPGALAPVSRELFEGVPA